MSEFTDIVPSAPELAGEKAWREGNPITVCPFSNSRERYEWQQGWRRSEVRRRAEVAAKMDAQTPDDTGAIIP